MKHIDYSKTTDKTYWDELAESGNTYQHGITKHRDKIMKLMSKNKVTSLLDVGCGTGPMFPLIKEYYEKLPKLPRYKGIDYSKGFIDIAKKEFGDEFFEVQDARKLKEKKNSWDMVLLMHCLDHVDDWKQVLQEAKRVSSRFVLIILWRSFIESEDWVHQTVMNDTLYKDTFLREYRQKDFEAELARQDMKTISRGNILNKDKKYNYYYFLLI